jgi:hypothetical protein
MMARMWHKKLPTPPAKKRYYPYYVSSRGYTRKEDNETSRPGEQSIGVTLSGLWKF